MANLAISALAGDQINRGKQMASADLDKVKGDTINALNQFIIANNSYNSVLEAVIKERNNMRGE